MKKIIFLAFTLIILAVISCRKDFVVKDIKDGTITINSPANNLVTTSNQVTFWWEALDGAEKYKLQVVKPAFNAITQIILDTSITGTKYTLSLLPGNYQWRLSAYNNGGSTAYQTYNLTVDTTSNLSNLLVSTNSPVNGALTGSRTVVFSWNSLNAATQYEIVLLNSNNGTIKDTITASTNYTYTFPNVSAVYYWKVRAQNNFSISQFNSPLSFTIDLTAPAVSTPSAPSHGATVTSTASLAWSRVGVPDAKADCVYVATDSAFTNIFSRTLTFQTSIPINSLNTAPTSTGTIYWWKLKTRDSVMNMSSYSNQLKFKLN